MHINELTNPSHTSIMDKIADLLEMVSSETEIAYCPNFRISRCKPFL